MKKNEKHRTENKIKNKDFRFIKFVILELEFSTEYHF